jgi:hypothetical protein
MAATSASLLCLLLLLGTVSSHIVQVTDPFSSLHAWVKIQRTLSFRVRRRHKLQIKRKRERARGKRFKKEAGRPRVLKSVRRRE